ncbi:MAG: NAD-dependent succinate-semialdehyde dehydrogenase [Candidatus Portiera sp.]|nr:NAD-dependent succinate-semialdehyde dehydrogenase [Portiera sp.]
MFEIKSSRFFEEKCRIGDKWCDADDSSVIEITNPATQQVIGTVPKVGARETARAIEVASVQGKEWASRTAKERHGLLKKWFSLIIDNQDELGQILVTEQGKPLAEAVKEVAYGASFIEWFAEEGRRAYGDIIPSGIPNTEIRVTKEPVGVVGIIIPWNFPSAMISRKVGAALAAGCSCVIKPAELTPYSAIALIKLAEEAGIPPGILNLVTGDPQVIGKELTTNPIVKKLSFTGSTAVGKLIMQQCSSTVKKVSLELGGNAPFIVFEDADLDAAVDGLMVSKFRNSGQTCVCANRIFVQAAIYDKFLAKLKQAVAKLIPGDGMADGSTQGPLINEQAVVKVEKHIQDMLDRGGKLVCGGKRHELGGTFFEPTIISEVQIGSLPCHEETFGPVAPLYKFATEEEAVTMANNTQYGLSAYFYSSDLERVQRVSSSLEDGIIGVNCGIISNEVSPFGGVKESGIGREGSKYGLDEYLNIKYTLFQYKAQNIKRRI